MSPMSGSDYRALRRLSTKENETLADVGEMCDRVPAESLPALVASGKIELAVERRAPAATSTTTETTAPPTNRRKVRR